MNLFKALRFIQLLYEIEREGLITSTECRKLVQQAGTLFESTAECMGGAKEEGRSALCRSRVSASDSPLMANSVEKVGFSVRLNPGTIPPENLLTTLSGFSALR
jgi:hypothetical protein